MMSSGTVARSARQALRVPSERGLGDLLEQDVRFAVEDAVALLNRGAADGLREMALARAGHAEKEDVFAPLDEAAGGELVDQGAIHLLVEVEIEGVERAVGVAEAGLLVPAGQEPVLAADAVRRGRAWTRGRAGRAVRSGLDAAGLRGRRPCRTVGACAGRDRVRADSCVISCRAIDQIAVEGELPNERIDLPERHRRAPLQIAPQEAVGGDAELEGGAGPPPRPWARRTSWPARGRRGCAGRPAWPSW